MKTIALVLIGFVLIGVLGIGGLKMFTESTNGMITPTGTELMRITGTVQNTKPTEKETYELAIENGSTTKLESDSVDLSSYIGREATFLGLYSDDVFIVKSVEAAE